MDAPSQQKEPLLEQPAAQYPQYPYGGAQAYGQPAYGAQQPAYGAQQSAYGAQPQYGAPQQQGQPPYSGQYYGGQQVVVVNSGVAPVAYVMAPAPGSELAQRSLLFGVLSLLCLPLILSVLAIVYGVMALRAVGANDSDSRCKAIAGISLGGVSIAVVIAVIIVIATTFNAIYV